MSAARQYRRLTLTDLGAEVAVAWSGSIPAFNLAISPLLTTDNASLYSRLFSKERYDILDILCEVMAE